MIPAPFFQFSSLHVCEMVPLLHQARRPNPAVQAIKSMPLKRRFSRGLRPKQQCRPNDTARNNQVRMDPVVSYIVVELA